MPRTLAKRKGTHSLRALILIGDKQVIEAFVAEGLEEPFTTKSITQPCIILET